MPFEIEFVVKLVVLVFSVAGGVYTLRNSINLLSLNYEHVKSAVEDIKGEQKILKECDAFIKEHNTRIATLVEIGAEYRANDDKIHSDLYSHVNTLRSRVQSCETCNEFIRRDIEDIKKKVYKK